MSELFEFFARFDDDMEAQQPGYKTRKAEEAAKRKRQWADYRDAVIAKYGSADAVKALTPLEWVTEAAIAPLRRSVRVGKHTVESLDGWHDSLSARKAPDSVRRAVEQAWQMPSTSFCRSCGCLLGFDDPDTDTGGFPRALVYHSPLLRGRASPRGRAGAVLRPIDPSNSEPFVEVGQYPGKSLKKLSAV